MRKRPDYGDATAEDLARALMRPKHSTTKEDSKPTKVGDRIRTPQPAPPPPDRTDPKHT